jgi:hypothetical protein
LLLLLLLLLLRLLLLLLLLLLQAMHPTVNVTSTAAARQYTMLSVSPVSPGLLLLLLLLLQAMHPTVTLYKQHCCQAVNHIACLTCLSWSHCRCCCCCC